MTDYSRGDYADLPAGTTDLENNYTAPDLTAITSNDNSTYAEQTANNEIAIHQYKKTVTGQYTNITWSGKSSLAPSESPVIMEVYNVNGTVWEELDRDDSTAADTDFDIIYNNLATADYLDSGVITWRVYQAASAGPVTKYIGLGTHDGGQACDYSGFEDACLSPGGNSAYNYGGSTILLIYGSPTTGNALINVTGLSNIATTVTVTDAKLHLFSHDGNMGGGVTFNLRRMRRAWVVGTQIDYFATEDTPDSCCWDYYGSSSGWGTAGALNTTSDVLDTDSWSAVIAAANEGWQVITSATLISDVQDMISTPAGNYGWQLYSSDIWGTNYMQLDSSQCATEANRPYLEVTYTV